jgi:GntR family transcriptional repressor for pyruvate dehydrogenase complex
MTLTPLQLHAILTGVVRPLNKLVEDTRIPGVLFAPQPRASLVDTVAERLAERVRGVAYGDSGQFRSERALALEFGVSMPVLREAVRRLEAQGLVEVKHGVGVTAASKLHKPLASSVTYLLPDIADRLARLTEVRQMIEPQAARLAAERIEEPHLSEMRRANADLAESEGLEVAVDGDLRFHLALSRASGNPILVLLYQTIADLGAKSRAVTISTFGVDAAVAQHAAILDAIERRDADAAEDAMARHLRITESELAAIASKSDVWEGA